MHIVAYVFRRAPGMSLDAFREYYETVHGPLMVRVLKDRGLVSYDHYPTRPPGLGDEYVPAEGPAYDALSILAFESPEAAAAAWPLPDVVEDSRAFIDFETMVTLPLTHRRVFPVGAEAGQ